MAINQKHVFWEALLISIFIFGVGLIVGIALENSRSAESLELYLSSESNLLDVQIFSRLIEESNDSCDLLIKKNIEFGDKIYNDAVKIEKYEDAQKITPRIIDQHKRYDLLRTLFWINSMKIKEKCDSFSIVVYLYEYEPEGIEIKAKQKVFSNYLSDIKNQFGGDIVLIPIATNMKLNSLDILIDKYNLSQVAIVVDERLFVEEETELTEIGDYLVELYHNNP